MPTTAIEIAQFAAATGTYTGVLNVLDTTTNLPVPGTATNVTVILDQSTTPNADGEFPLTGTITATGACAGTFPIANEVVAGGVFMPLPVTGPLGVFDGGIIPTGTTLIADFMPYSACGSRALLRHPHPPVTLPHNPNHPLRRAPGGKMLLRVCAPNSIS